MIVIELEKKKTNGIKENHLMYSEKEFGLYFPEEGIVTDWPNAEVGDWVLTDDGYTIADLKLSGCEFTTEKRRRILYSILNGFGIQLDGDELFTNAMPSNFPQKKHNLIQAMLSINDLFVLADS